MTITQKAFRGASWLAFFRLISQTFSWVATIAVARLLVPGDYGLMEMATILTGYIVLFSELGLGSAIIQKKDIKQEELSSLFWLLLCWGCILAVGSIILAYPTVAIFREQRLLRITQATSVLFITGSLLIIPYSILNKELRFKAMGVIDAISVIIASVSMLVIAKLGGGVWTLIGGNIIREISRTVLVLSVVSWRPRMHFNYAEIKPYVGFGVNIAASNSMYYLYTKSDRFFGGKILGAGILGYYSLALQLACIPTDKIVSLINNVSYPVFANYQGNHDEFNNFYLKLVKWVAFITMPLFVGGIFLAGQLIPAVLGPKWMPIILPFKLLCAAQLIICLTSSNAVVFNALGMPRINLYIGIINVLLVPLSFYISASYGLAYLVLPWITVFPAIRFAHTWITLKKLDISLSDYLMNILQPALATLLMLSVLILFKVSWPDNLQTASGFNPYLLSAVMAGSASYAAYIYFFQRNIYESLISLRRKSD